MEAKGLDTSGIDAKIQAAYGKLNNVQKGVVNFLTSEKMMAGHIENVTKSNPSYANYKGSPTTPKGPTPTKKEEKGFLSDPSKRKSDVGFDREPNYEKFSQTTEKETKTEKAIKESAKGVKGKQKDKTQADLSKAYGGGDGNLASGKFGGNKGGLLNKPKRNPKKPRGKGLGSK